MRKLNRVLVAGAAIAAMSGAVAAPAGAANRDGRGYVSVVMGIKHCAFSPSITTYQPIGDTGGAVPTVTSQDYCRDHHSAVAEWKVGSWHARVHRIWNHKGYDSITAVRLDVKRKRRAWVRSCTGDYRGRKIVHCSHWILNHR